jgi:uncharacterized HAD superfamily protein
MKKAIVDIDGVLNYYPDTFISYVNDTLNTEFSTLSKVKESISYFLYKQLKEDYRQSNYKHRAIPARGAKQMLKALRDNDYLIYIVTSRPLFKYNMLEDTIKWLKDNDLVYDYIYCSQKKDFTIFEKFGHVDFVIDDNCNNIDTIAKINGDECVYVNVINNDNRSKKCKKGIRINDLSYVQELII